jgi:hypothetical protein
VEAFVKARLALVDGVVKGTVEEDDLDSPDRIEEQLEQLPGLFRCVCFCLWFCVWFCLCFCECFCVCLCVCLSADARVGSGA